MQIYFTSRASLRQFANKTNNGKAQDNGKEAAKRWAFKLNKQQGQLINLIRFEIQAHYVEQQTSKENINYANCPLLQLQRTHDIQ